MWNPSTSKVRDVIDRHAGEIDYVEVDDPGISDDIDDPALYEQLLAREASNHEAQAAALVFRARRCCCSPQFHVPKISARRVSATGSTRRLRRRLAGRLKSGKSGFACFRRRG